VRSTAAYILREATMNEEMAKRLALGMAILCVRNTCIEDLHAGIEPSSQAGDFSDVKVVTPYGEIPWNKLSRIRDDDMRDFHEAGRRPDLYGAASMGRSGIC
jgi:hypothetical protein